MTTEADIRERFEDAVIGLEDGRRGLVPRNAGSLWTLENARKWILPWSFQKGPSLLRP